LSRGAEAARIVRSPMISPEPPIPATVLPIMNMSEYFETAQIKDPNSNIARPIKNANWNPLSGVSPDWSRTLHTFEV